MADTALTEQVFHLQQAALSSATKKAYQAGSKRYYAFCKKYHIIPFPTTELTLCYFAAYLSRSVQHPTVRLYLAAVRSEQLRQGWPELPKNTAQLSQLLQGLKRCARPRTRLALTPATLNQLIHGVLNNCKLSKHDRYLYAAAISLAYFGCLRVGKISYPTTKRFQSNKHLTVGDIELVQNSIKLYLKQSKTDQAGIGTKIVIGQSGHDICPVKIMSKFRRLTLSKRASKKDAFFRLKDGSLLTQARLQTVMHAILSSLGLPAELYGTHSLRIGAATAAAEAGVPVDTIKAMGRWTSECYRYYTRSPHKALANLSSKLCGSQP